MEETTIYYKKAYIICTSSSYFFDESRKILDRDLVNKLNDQKEQEDLLIMS